MLGRSDVAALRSWILFGVVAAITGCESGSPEVSPDECFVETAQEPIKTCFPRPLYPVTDPESPDYGRVPCVAIVSGRAGTPFCDCARPGYSPASADQAEVARDELEAMALCVDACCEHYCFCELQQLSGDELAWCQGLDDTEYEPGYAPQGWCYVDADAGIGDPSLVEHCPDTQRRLVLFVPPYVLMSGNVTYLACLQ